MASNLAQIVQSHSCVDKADSMYDIHHSPSWLHTYHPDGVFKGDNRGIALGLCTDGVNPFSHLRVSYSMWPIMFTLLNLPRQVRHAYNNIILVGIVPGNGKKEPKDINPYLEIVVDEFLPLSNVTQYDSYQNAPFQLKIEVLCTLWTIQGWKKSRVLLEQGPTKAVLGVISKVFTPVLILVHRIRMYYVQGGCLYYHNTLISHFRYLQQRPSEDDIFTKSEIPSGLFVTS